MLCTSLTFLHFAGVHPAWRRERPAHDMYRRFFGILRAAGRPVVRAVTADHGPQGDLVVRFELRLDEVGQ